MYGDMGPRDMGHRDMGYRDRGHRDMGYGTGGFGELFRVRDITLRSSREDPPRRRVLSLQSKN